MTTTPEFYTTIPALKSYIDRVGAKEKNFRRYIVEVRRGAYFDELCVIKLERDGTITCDPEDLAYVPTSIEKAAIKQALETIEMPRSIEIRPAGVDDLRAQLGRDADLHEFYNQVSGNVRMVQQRIDAPEGKRYFPWSYWNDGLWRPMEPDGELPFWKPKESTGKTKIMVHEGAKAAAHVTAMCADENCTHPWIEELREYEHWGMIGGALSPHRADYKELWDRNPELMVYVADNDWPGKSAVPKVSKKYGRRMAGVTFDDSFPDHWDMADPMPLTMFKDGRYIGKRLKDCMRSCTWATVEVRVGKKPFCKINPAFEQEWSHSSKPTAYVQNELPREIRLEDEFNNWVRAFSDVKNTAELLNKSSVSKAARMVYDPRRPSGKAIGSANDDILNTYLPPEITPLEGDCAPLESYFEETFPVEPDRIELIRWVATLVVHPQIKMKYGVLLVSETQGVGKSTLGEILKPLIGEWNCSEPSIKMVSDNTFNEWVVHKRLAVIQEAHEGHGSKAYLELKSVITEPTITVNRKYQSAYKVDNWMHVLACSNSKKALKLDDKDRRWLVPNVSERKRDPQKWIELHKWLNEQDGLRKIRWWLEDWLLRNGGSVNPSAHAPKSATKDEVVKEGYTQGEELTVETLERISEQHPGKSILWFDVDMRAKIAEHGHNGRLEKVEGPLMIRNVAKSIKWHVVERPVQIRQGLWHRHTKTRAMTNNPELVGKPISELWAMVEREEVVFVDVKRAF